MSENVIRARFGGPRAETGYGKRPKTAVGHWEKGRSRGVYESIRKTPTGKTKQTSVASSPSIPLSRGWPQKGPFGPFWAPGGLGPIRKRRFGCHAKTAAGNGSNPIRLLKCHVRREKGPTRGPRGPSVAGRGAHVSPIGNFSGGQTKSPV